MRAALSVALPVLFAQLVAARLVTIRNDRPRLDVDGRYIDAHDGKIVAAHGQYYLYGEAYGNQTLAEAYPWKSWPRLKVYTSPDLVHWTLRGDPLPMIQGTLWIPNVLFNASGLNRFVMWFGSGGWQSAVSMDGIHFTPSKYGAFASRFGARARTDGTGIFVDDDGTGYVAFASNPPGIDWPGTPTWPGHPHALGYGHIVSIERMSADLLTTSKVNVTGLFPDDYVESPSLFKRKGVYYLTYGSCCCGCAAGGGQVVWTSTEGVAGPWTRQSHADINCRDDKALICGGYGKRAGNRKDLVYNAQWWGPSFIPLKGGDTQVLYLGRRWLSGPNLPAGCDTICHDPKCQKGGDRYEMRSDLSVWYPLEFENVTDGQTTAIQPMRPLDSFTLDLPELG